MEMANSGEKDYLLIWRKALVYYVFTSILKGQPIQFT